MKVINFLGLWLFSIVGLSCTRDEQKIHFYQPKERITIITIENRKQYNDVVFIYNPPDNKEQLIRIIEDYNRSTLKKDTVESAYSYFQRSFYRVSKKTPADFKDDESFSPDYLYDHKYDLIANYRMKESYLSNSEFIWVLSSDNGYLDFETIYH